MSSPSHAHAPTHTQGPVPGGPEGPSLFWDDFWNTLYQFTHPFSSTFFDSLFNDNDPADAASSSSQSASSQSAGSGPATDSSSTAGETRHFKDEVSFEKFWHGLQKGTNQQQTSPTTPLEHVQAAWIDFKSSSTGFISAVEWQQTWIQMILALHLTIFIVIILIRNRPNGLAAMLFCTILLAALSEPLNGIGSRHWQLFSDDNYFDQHGVFTSLVWAAPHLVNAILAVLLLLRNTVKLLVKFKRAQLQENKRKKQK
ncbi:transmembrane protein 18-domain-containing protein [Dissophora ornata]|nr:hypothetical protein BGZ58_002853 [Dissophora ornata]KAI8598927.1 transmembrane protein 18-domain-containing protein [Dissophora ornata]